MIPNNLTTEEFAQALHVKPSSVRVRLCRTGSYFGIRPIKLPNRLLSWPADGPERLRQTTIDPKRDGKV
jgi:hypothetical protein